MRGAASKSYPTGAGSQDAEICTSAGRSQGFSGKLLGEFLMKTGVLVAGAGPVGLAMAAELARYGVSIRIVEKAAQRTDKSKAIVIWSRTLEMIDRMGCTAAFLAEGFKVSAANIVASDKQIARITLGGVASPHPYALMLPQSDTERLLELHLNFFGVQVERSVEITKFESAQNGITSTLRHADGREETIATSWLIGCDGAHSSVRHQLGMQFTGGTQPSNWILADLHLSGMPNPGEIQVDWHSDGVLAIFPIKEDRYRIIADVGNTSGNEQPPDPTLEEVQAILDKRGPGGVKGSAPIWLAGFHINERKVADYRSGRVFLAGDAAHVHSPAGGQGMNTGIQDACNLAWKLALVCRGLCAEEPLLESYSIERSAVGDEVLKNAGRLTEMAIMRGEIKQSIRNHLASLVFGLAPVRHKMADAMTEVSVGYPESPLSGHGAHVSGGPAAGERAPIREGELPVGSGDTPRFVLFTEADDSSALLPARYPDLLESEIRKPFHEGGLWLVRPDGYTALATKNRNGNEVAAYLDLIAIPA
jgi:2-polyprenyl-6-methoxyphenol hydroxylase-like FAD-dependent oxidoreductase